MNRRTPNRRNSGIIWRADERSITTKSKVRDLPNKPGVYLMRDQLGRVIYVGKARSLRKRVGSTFIRRERCVGTRRHERSSIPSPISRRSS